MYISVAEQLCGHIRNGNRAFKTNTISIRYHPSLVNVITVFARGNGVCICVWVRARGDFNFPLSKETYTLYTRGVLVFDEKLSVRRERIGARRHKEMSYIDCTVLTIRAYIVYVYTASRAANPIHN